MSPLELQLRLLKDKVEVLEAKIDHEGNSAVDAVNDMAQRLNSMVANQNSQILSQIDGKLTQAFDSVNSAFSESIKESLILEETLEALVKLVLVGKKLSDEDDDAIKETLLNFLTRNV